MHKKLVCYGRVLVVYTETLLCYYATMAALHMFIATCYIPHSFAVPPLEDRLTADPRAPHPQG